MNDLRKHFLRLDGWPIRVVPTDQPEIDKAVETLRFRLGTHSIPLPAFRKLLLPYFAKGWCPKAVEHALRWRPNGTHQATFSAARSDWLVERQLAKWVDRDGEVMAPPVDAQTAEDAYRVMGEVLERIRPGAMPNAAAHASRRSAVDAARDEETERQRRRRHDRVAMCLESDRKRRAALGDLARMAGQHDSENVQEIPLPTWRNEQDRRQQQSELIGSARSGYLDFTERVRERLLVEGSAMITPQLRKVAAQRSREARTEASLSYLEILIDEVDRAG